MKAHFELQIWFKCLGCSLFEFSFAKCFRLRSPESQTSAMVVSYTATWLRRRLFLVTFSWTYGGGDSLSENVLITTWLRKLIKKILELRKTSIGIRVAMSTDLQRLTNRVTVEGSSCTHPGVYASGRCRELLGWMGGQGGAAISREYYKKT